jgi:hypothetical protein
MATGGHVVHYNRGQEPVVRIPQKTTGDVPAEQAAGLAKASPFFKKLAEVMPKTKAEEKKVVAEAIVKPVVAEDQSATKENEQENEEAE